MTEINRKTHAKPLICVLGPTASGKTAFAVQLAKRINGEIISADSRQVYEGLDIGSGKDISEYGTVPYHLIDIVKPSEEYNIFRFVQDYNAADALIRQKQKSVILCGGSGLYVDAIISRYEMVKAQDKTIEQLLKTYTHEQLVEQLKEKEPSLHNSTDLSEPKRTASALAIAMAKQSKSEILQAVETKPFLFATKLSRESLKQKIHKRLLQRFDEGMIEEVQGLLAQGLDPEKLNFFGLEYRYVAQHITGQLNYNDMFQKLNSSIVRFSKQQEKWLRNFEKKGHAIHWLGNSMEENLSLVEQVLAPYELT